MLRGLNPDGGEIFLACLDRSWVPTSLLYNGYRVTFQGIKRPGRDVDHPPHPAPRLRKSRAIPLLLLWAFMAKHEERYDHGLCGF
jgi:hypothetical protein